MPPLKVKINGYPRDIDRLVRALEQEYYVTKTSGFIQHQEDDQVHLFVLLVEEVGSQ